MYMTAPKLEQGEQPDTDLREMQFKKSNYGPISNNIALRYNGGLFLPEGGMNSLDKAARELAAEDAFLQTLKRLSDQNQDLGPNTTGSNYGPTVIAANVKGFRKTEFESAMRRLLDGNKIHIRVEGPTSKRRKYLTPGPAPQSRAE